VKGGVLHAWNSVDAKGRRRHGLRERFRPCTNASVENVLLELLSRVRFPQPFRRWLPRDASMV
jgi:hypothetical protein